jgi:hypothetical protein
MEGTTNKTKPESQTTINEKTLKKVSKFQREDTNPSKKKKVEKTENFQLIKAELLPTAPLTPESVTKMGKNAENSTFVEKHFETLYMDAVLKLKSLEDENAKFKTQIQNLLIAKQSDDLSTELMLQAYHSISRVIAICSGKLSVTSSKVIDTRISIFKAGDGIEFTISKNLENLWINADKFSPSQCTDSYIQN